MSEIITMGAAAIYLIVANSFLSVSGNLNKLLFRAVPMLIGAALALQAFGKFMGWPV